MKVLAYLNGRELGLAKEIALALNSIPHELDVLEKLDSNSGVCNQSEAIQARLKGIEVLIYFASKENDGDSCIDFALAQAARFNIRVICIWLDKDAIISGGFEKFGDSLVSGVSGLEQAVLGEKAEWESAGNETIGVKAFKRYKCGAKE